MLKEGAVQSPPAELMGTVPETQTMYRFWGFCLRTLRVRSSVVLHPAVLGDECVDDFLHGQVGDELFLGQGAPGHRVKMAHTLQLQQGRVLSMRELCLWP